jgi:hypothetical protein
MSSYELSIDPKLVAEAERLVTLEGRGYPTLVVSWLSDMLGQEWQTILVLDYTIPLPPLAAGTTFNEVRIAAYTDGVPTKFLYFGTELNEDAPRRAPEMENVVSPAERYQEYRLNEETCAVPYLDLIQTTPRIYGNGPQDYYSPPIKVDRFDAGAGVELISDNFPTVVANLPAISGASLTDPRRGFWRGGRFLGTRAIAILRQGKVVGLNRRVSDREVVPPEVPRRDPHTDVKDSWVAIDLGMSTTVVAIGDGESHELVRVGATRPPKSPIDFETPNEVAFGNLPRTLKGWNDRVILPLTCWGDVYVGFGARERRLVHGKERAQRTKASLAELSTLPARLAAGKDVFICGSNDIDRVHKLEPPAPPIIDEEGIQPDDPFDPLELFAYYIGLHVNSRERGLHLRYAIGMPTGWNQERRTQVLAELRRGILRSLPAGMVAYDDLKQLQVVDAGPNVLSFAAQAFRVFGIRPKAMESVPFVSIDAGASETAIMCGHYRDGTLEETAAGFKRVVEHVEPTVLSDFGGELLLHRMAYKVYAASGTSMKHNAIPFEPPPGEALMDGAEDRLVSSFDAQVNVRLLKDAVRPILDKPGPAPLPDVIQLYGRDGQLRDVRIMVDRAVLSEWLRGQLSALAAKIKEAIVAGFGQVSRDEVAWDELRVLLGGRVGMHAVLQERLDAVLPKGVRMHKFREPDHTNLNAPTVKIATALGILTLRYQPVGPSEVSDERTTFNFRVGRAKRGKLLTVLDQGSGFDVWRELGACTRPDVTVLYTPSSSSSSSSSQTDPSGGAELAADDPSIVSVVCSLGYDAVGYRVYMRAVGGSSVEVSVGPPGGRPDDDAVCWAVDLDTGTAQPMSKH